MPDHFAEILDKLDDSGFCDEKLTIEIFGDWIDQGASSQQFRQLCCNIMKEISILEGFLNEFLTNFDETCASDEQNFINNSKQFFISHGQHFLRSLIDGPDALFSDINHKLNFVDDIISHLQGCRVLVYKAQVNVSESEAWFGSIGSQHEHMSPEKVATTEEFNVIVPLRDICKTLEIPFSTDAITLINSEIIPKIELLLQKLPKDCITGPLLKQEKLSLDQQSELEDINNTLAAEYKLRREMLIRRLDVTLQSFMWAEKAKENEMEIRRAIVSMRQQLQKYFSIELFDVYTASKDLLLTSMKVSNPLASSLKQIKIGNVPDRGGRPNERFAATSAMPQFRSRNVTNESTSAGSSSGQSSKSHAARGASSGGKRGGRVQGSWGRGRGY